LLTAIKRTADGARDDFRAAPAIWLCICARFSAMEGMRAAEGAGAAFRARRQDGV